VVWAAPPAQIFFFIIIVGVFIFTYIYIYIIFYFLDLFCFVQVLKAQGTKTSVTFFLMEEDGI
jgi:hypothetical protein